MREPNRPQCLKAIEARHQHVEQNDVGQRAFAQRRQQRITAVVTRGVVAARAEEGLQIFGKRFVVVNDCECGAAHTVTNGRRRPTDAV